MNVRLAPSFTRAYDSASPPVQRAFDKQLRHLLTAIRHPSLHAKKYDEAHNIWQARVTKGWRFYFRIEGNTYHILDLISHPK